MNKTIKYTLIYTLLTLEATNLPTNNMSRNLRLLNQYSNVQKMIQYGIELFT